MILPDHLQINDFHSLLKNTITLSATANQAIQHAADFLNKKVVADFTYYGINTGFGSLHNVKIEKSELAQLQENLVKSHACGMGDEVPKDIVKLMLLLKLQNIAQGHSGIQPETVERLLFFYNNNILPVVYQQGSLGASGDLAPLAHLALPLLGLGEVYWNDKKVATTEVLSHYQLQPLKLKAKEGLGLLNGTQFMSAYGAWALMQSHKLSQWADAIAAISLEAFDGKAEPYTAQIHQARPHPGQIATAQNILDWIAGSELQTNIKEQVQDPYSFRCVPQVHGATKDALAHINNVFEIEINAATDNPLLFVEDDLILSGGNFHGQPLAINLDYAAIAMAELANISERRTYLLVSGQRYLPAFLAPNPGVNSGFMIAQYTAAAIVSENKQFCTPASVDSIVSSNGQEDHVSMGANAATKLYRIINNVQRVLAIELLCAAQALEFRKPKKSSDKIEQLIAAFRKEISFNDADRLLHNDLVKAEKFLDKGVKDYL